MGEDSEEGKGSVSDFTVYNISDCVSVMISSLVKRYC